MSATKKAAKKTVARKPASKPVTRNGTSNELVLEPELAPARLESASSSHHGLYVYGVIEMPAFWQLRPQQYWLIS